MPTLLIIIEFQTFDEKVNNLYILLYTKTFLSIYDYVTLYSLSAQKNITLSKCTYYTYMYIYSAECEITHKCICFVNNCTAIINPLLRLCKHWNSFNVSTVVDLDEPVDDSLRVCLVQLLLPEDGDVLPDRAEQPYHGRHLYQSPPFLPLLNKSSFFLYTKIWS